MVSDVLAQIGGDRLLTVSDVRGDAPAPFVAEAWQQYRDHFGGFTGSRIDAQFSRLAQPAQFSAQPRVSPGTTIVIAGAGPSLRQRAAELTRLRTRLSIWTSIRGAEALAACGLTPDLVLVQHVTDLDTYLTVRHLRDRNGANPVAHVPAVLAEPKTPASLLAGLDGERLATFDPACGWGHWAASLAWLAGSAGATAIALVGVDLGEPGAVDPLHQPLSSLLGLIAQGCSTPTIDAGNGAVKAGWPRQLLDATVGPTGSPAVTLDLSPWSSAEERRAELQRSIVTLRDHIEAAQTFRARAFACRASNGHEHDSALGAAWDILRRWRECQSIREAFQEGLGVTFLPRFWRMDDRNVKGPLWRPVLLATDDIVRQAEVARSHLDLMVTA